MEMQAIEGNLHEELRGEFCDRAKWEPHGVDSKGICRRVDVVVSCVAHVAIHKHEGRFYFTSTDATGDYIYNGVAADETFTTEGEAMQAAWKYFKSAVECRARCNAIS